MVHVCLFQRGCDTILRETADSHELFVINQCEECPAGCIMGKAKVKI